MDTTSATNPVAAVAIEIPETPATAISGNNRESAGDHDKVQIAASSSAPAAVAIPSLCDSKNAELARILRSEVGFPYNDKEGHNNDNHGIDCSGTLYYALTKMGYKMTRFSVRTLVSGRYPFIRFYKSPDKGREGQVGVINVYSYFNEYDHLNIGVGRLAGEINDQIIDATHPDVKNWEKIRGNALPGQVNRTYAPFPSAAPVLQLYIDWEIL
jgi:hypothetical protein